MAFNHKLMATDGLFPGLFTHFSFAVLGHWFVDVIITPPKDPDLGYSDLQYQITIRVRRKDKTWEHSQYVSYFTGKSMEKVNMFFVGMRSLKDSISLKMGFLTKRIKDVFVKVKKKDD